MANLMKPTCRKRKPLHPPKVKDHRPVAQRACNRDQRIARARLLARDALDSHAAEMRDAAP